MNFHEYSSHYKALIKMGFPIVVGQLGVIILGFADTIMIGHHTTEELAAASFVNNMFALAIIFCTGFSYGLTPMVGEFFGSDNKTEIGSLLKNSIIANVLVGIIITIIMGILYVNIEKLGQPEELMVYIKPYFLVVLASIIFVMLFNSFKQFSEGITDTLTPMWILITGNIINIAGNYILIYGKFGAPELGLLGAGISTLVSRILMFIIFAIIFIKAKKYSIYREGYKSKGFRKESFKNLNKLGWPVAFQLGMESASFNLSAIMVGWIGSLALAAHQVAVTVSTLSFMVLYGIGSAISIRVSYFKGQNDFVNVRRTAFAGYHISLVFCVMACLLFFSIRNFIGSWFTSDAEVCTTVSTLMYVLMLYQFGDGTQIVFANALRGISDVRPMMYIAFFAYFIVSLPVGYIFGFVADLGIHGIWLAYPVGLSLAGILFIIRFNKKTKSLLHLQADTCRTIK